MRKSGAFEIKEGVYRMISKVTDTTGERIIGLGYSQHEALQDALNKIQLYSKAKRLPKSELDKHYLKPGNIVYAVVNLEPVHAYKVTHITGGLAYCSQLPKRGKVVNPGLSELILETRIPETGHLRLVGSRNNALKYELETSELRCLYQLRSNIREIQAFNFSKLSLEQSKKILFIINKK